MERIKVRPIPGIPKYISRRIEPVIKNGRVIMMRVMIGIIAFLSIWTNITLDLVAPLASAVMM